MTKQPVVQPVVSDLAQRWLRGEISSESYFAVCRRLAEVEARRGVAARLKRRQEA